MIYWWKFGLIEIASIIIDELGELLEVYKVGKISSWHWTTNNLRISELWQKISFNVIAMLAQSYFALPLNQNILDHFFAWRFSSFHQFAHFGRIYNEKNMQD